MEVRHINRSSSATRQPKVDTGTSLMSKIHCPTSSGTPLCLETCAGLRVAYVMNSDTCAGTRIHRGRRAVGAAAISRWPLRTV